MNIAQISEIIQANNYTHGFVKNRTLLFFKSQQAMTREVNKAKKEFGANKEGDPKKCGAYGAFTVNNLHFFTT